MFFLKKFKFKPSVICLAKINKSNLHNKSCIKFKNLDDPILTSPKTFQKIAGKKLPNSPLSI